MKVLPSILLVALVGCGRQVPPNTASQMSHQIEQWVPRGTRVAAVQQIMEEHQFVCAVGSYDSRAAMPPGTDQKWWTVGSYFASGGKILPVTNVTILTCKRADTTNDAWAYDATFMAVDGEFDGTYNVSAHRVR